MVLVKLPLSSRVWALPFMTVLCWPKGTRKRHKTIIKILIQIIRQVRRWVKTRRMILVVDGAFSANELAAACHNQEVTLVSRLRMDAALYDYPEPVAPGRRGRKPLKGKRQRLLKEWAERADTKWEKVDVEWYAGATKEMKVVTGTAIWFKGGKKPVEVRWVLAKDPEGKMRDAAYFCTETKATAAQILGWVVMRWAVEVAFQEMRAQMGMQTQRQWSDKAIRRTTPALMGMYTIITLQALHLHKEGKLLVKQTAWYKKKEATFSDCIGEVRRQIWKARYKQGSVLEADDIKITRESFEELIDSLPLAA